MDIAVHNRDASELFTIFESTKTALLSAQEALHKDAESAASAISVQLRGDVEALLSAEVVKLMGTNATNAEIDQFVTYCFAAAEKGCCQALYVVAVLREIFEVCSTGRCEELFYLVDSRIPQWKTKFYFDSCKNHLLRLCNDILKRLSRTVHTEFCGRILIFLARCLPLSEKSGLNLAGVCNADNTTIYEPDRRAGVGPTAGAAAEDANTGLGVGPEAADSSAAAVDMEVEEGEMKESSTIPVDYSLYCKFWQLQKYFSQPQNCYERVEWRQFQRGLNEVFSALASYKLEPGRAERDTGSTTKISEPVNNDLGMSALEESLVLKRKTTVDAGVSGSGDDSHSYSAKYLTSQKLLQLQLNDSQFRRYFLVQCVILFNYLQSTVTIKAMKVQPLTDEQTKWVSDNLEKCYKLMKETHPDGQRFANAVKRIINREANWSNWKNDGCKDFTEAVTKAKDQM